MNRPKNSYREKFGGKGILVDLESSNSSLPDCLVPILAHRKYGRTPKLCAKLIVDTAIKEKQDRTSNDMFWSQFDFNERLSADCHFHKTLPALMPGTFVKDNGIMYIVSGREKDVSALFALLTLLGAAAAADTAGIQLTCLIPDIAASDIFEGVCAINGLFPRALHTIIGCGDFLRASRRTDLQPIAYFDRLTDLGNQNIIWHKSSDTFLKQIFQARTSGQDLMYSLGDLGGNHMIALEQGGEVRYAYIPNAAEIEHIPGVREERKEDTLDATPLWFFVEPPAFEDNAGCTEFDFDDDENEDILTQHSNSVVA